MSDIALVTGASGLLGRHVVARLSRDDVPVRALVRSEEGAETARRAGASELLIADLREEDTASRAVSGTQTVYNCAATVRTKGAWEDFASVNIHATRRLLQASLEQGVKKFVHVSSVGIFALPRYRETITEDTPTDPLAPKRGHYTRSKTLADELVRQWAARHPLPVTLIRPGHIYGPTAPCLDALPARLRATFTLFWRIPALSSGLPGLRTAPMHWCAPVAH